MAMNEFNTAEKQEVESWLTNITVEYIDFPGILSEALESIENSNVVYVDTETTGLDPHSSDILLIQLAIKSSDKVIVINANEIDEQDKSALLEFLNGRELVFHNAPFDLKFLSVFFNGELNILRLKIFDTKIAEALLCAGVNQNLKKFTSLKNVVYRRFGVEIEKETRKGFVNRSKNSTFSDLELMYAARDVRILNKIRSQQVEELKKYDMVEVAKLEFELAKHVAKMELDGVNIDVGGWKNFIKEAEKKKNKLLEEVHKEMEPYVEQKSMFGLPTFNINSSKQLHEFLTENVGLDIENTSEENLKLAGHPLCEKILEYREYEKLVTAFGENTLSKINKATGRMHPDFNQAYTSTGRFSSDNPNVQQIPSRGFGAEIRRFFIPSSGFKMICADYSQIELRILAELSQEPILVEAYNMGRDIHAQTASIAFGINIDDVTEEQRKIAKIINFATVYGGGPMAITKGLMQVISEEEAREILESVFEVHMNKVDVYFELSKWFLDSYFKNMPYAKDYLEKSGASAVNNGFSSTPLGRKRFYYELDEYYNSGSGNRSKDDESIYSLVSSVTRKGKNHPIQGCSADITKIAMVKIGEYFDEHPELQGKILLQVHDEIVTEVLEECAEEFSEVQRDIMEESGRRFLTLVPVVVDVEVADFWKK